MNEPSALDFTTIRRNMVERQLRPNKVVDPRILDAMGDIPRELFVPFTHVGVAYIDESVKLISDRHLMRPTLLARLLQAAEIKSDDRVLELAPATGYSTLVLTALSGKIFSVEPNSLLHKETEKNVSIYAPGRATVLAGAPVEGCVVHAPFDVIFINGAVEFIPDFLFTQLSEGGRLVTVIHAHDQAHTAHTGQARIYRRRKGEVLWTALFEATTPLAPGFQAPRPFEF